MRRSHAPLHNDRSDVQLLASLPGAIAAVRIHVVGAAEALDASLELRVAPAEVADTPAHHEIDVALTTRVEEIAACGTSYVEVAVCLFTEMALPRLFCRHVDGSAQESAEACR